MSTMWTQLQLFDLRQLIGAFFCAVTYAFYVFLSYRNRRTFPEPFGLPLIGHVFFLGSQPLTKFLEWQKTLGPVFQIRFGLKRVLILNDYKSIMEAFSNVKFAGRVDAVPLFKLLAARVGNGLAINEGPKVQQMRQFFMRSFSESSFQTRIKESIQEEMNELLDTWKTFENQPFQVYMAFAPLLNCFWKTFASHRFTLEETHFLFQQMADCFNFNSWKMKMAGFAPDWLEKVDKSAIDFKVEAWGRLVDLVRKECIEPHQATRTPGQPRDTVDAFLDYMDKTAVSDSVPANAKIDEASVILDILQGSVDAVTIFMEWFLFFSAKFPEHQQKLHEEIDAVLGTRPPTVEDKRNMPYTVAAIMETFRLGQPAFGVPHSTTSDVEFRGVLVPKGTMVLGNLMAVHRNPEIWPEPENFRPERFITPEGTLAPRTGMQLAPFGIGKRACPATSFNENMLFLFVTQLYQRYLVKSNSSLDEVEYLQEFGVRLKPGFEVCVSERQDFTNESRLNF